MDKPQMKTREELEQMSEDELRREFDALNESLEKIGRENARAIGEFHNMLADPKQRVKIQRNAPCPCGSGKKYKFCCMVFERKM